jgi:predicted glutamine amidotransferase
MCILVIKPTKVAMPSREILENCFDNNSDGAGFAFSDGRKIRLSKGHMTFDKFYAELESFGDLTKYPVMLHFRIATHGTVKPENTHPFNVNDRIVAAHNGILSIKPVDDMTDSETFFKFVCAPILKYTDIFSEELSSIVTNIIEYSKVAFLDDKGNVKMFGDFQESEGVYYSNGTYKSYTSSYSKYPSTYKGYGKGNSWDKYDNDWDKYEKSYSQYDSYKSPKKNGKASFHQAKTYIGGVEVGSEKHWEIAIALEDKISFSGYTPEAAFKDIAKQYGLSHASLDRLLEGMSDYAYLFSGLI